MEIRDLQMGGGKRITSFDAVKAFMILCVVYWHVSIFTGTTDSPVNNIFMPFYLTLFFFLNGYFSMIEGDIANVWKYRIIKRVNALLIPTVIMCSLYALYRGYTVYDVIFNDMKGGYWFTFVAFEIYVIFIFLEWSIRIQKRHKALLYLVIIISFSMLTIVGHKWDVYPVYKLFSAYQVIKYIPFFYLGLICRLYHDLFFKILGNGVIIGIAMAVMLFLYLFHNRISVCIQGYLGILVINAIFYKYKFYFDGNKMIPKIALQIGKNTLAIYFLHYFFLDGITYLSGIFNDVMLQGSWVLNGVMSTATVLVIIFLCLMVEKACSVSEVLHKLLFGRS